MNVQQGFNRIAVSVAATFVALAVVCLAIGGVNYLQYRNEVATEYARRYADNPQRLRNERFMLPHEKRGNWETFKTNRYRSVERSLYLSLFCVIAAITSALFWWSVGWFSVFWSTRRMVGR